MTVDGASAARDPAVCISELSRDDGAGLRFGLRRFQGARISVSSGSFDRARCISFRAETPSISEWCILV